MLNLFRACCCFTALALVAVGAQAQAQSFPERPIHIVVPFAPAAEPTC